MLGGPSQRPSRRLGEASRSNHGDSRGGGRKRVEGRGRGWPRQGREEGRAVGGSGGGFIQAEGEKLRLSHPAIGRHGVLRCPAVQVEEDVSVLMELDGLPR